MTDRAGIVERAQGCLLGQLAGDSLGSLVEFRDADSILRAYPDGIRDLADGGTHSTIAGQPTDDSEMALALARMLVAEGAYSQEKARLAYLDWLGSGAFDIGGTVRHGLTHDYGLEDSQANGAMMRISPLGIFGAMHSIEQVAEWAKQDAEITHPHPVCWQANVLYASAIAVAVRTGCEPQDLYERIREWAVSMDVEAPLMEVVEAAAESPPEDYFELMGWVLIAFRNALWQLLHAPTAEEAVIDTVMRGGDTDTNGAICGALAGAVHGIDEVPERWVEAVENCRPHAGNPAVAHVRPRRFWPIDAMSLAEQLAVGGQRWDGGS